MPPNIDQLKLRFTALMTRILEELNDRLGKTETAAAASKLAAARSISITGDATWQTTFDGSDNVSAVLSLVATGITAGTYTKVTVDSKGRVVQATNLAAADVPTLPISKITDLASTLDSKVANSAYTAADVLAKLKTVDGANSGLDADTLDGKELATIESDYKAYTDGRLTNVVRSTTIAANASYTLDAKTLFSDHAAFDLRSIQVRALLLDSTTGSPTNGYLINSESSLTVGVRDDGSILVHNHRDETSTVYITISRPSAPL